jgi:hypothetical protein
LVLSQQPWFLLLVISFVLLSSFVYELHHPKEIFESGFTQCRRLQQHGGDEYGGDEYGDEYDGKPNLRCPTFSADITECVYNTRAEKLLNQCLHSQSNSRRKTVGACFVGPCFDGGCYDGENGGYGDINNVDGNDGYNHEGDSNGEHMLVVMMVVVI